MFESAVDLVTSLYFGRDDAESDMAEGLLRDGFLPTTAFKAAQTGKKSLIIGRKGAGKSAICMQLAKGEHSYLITPDDAAGDEIRRFELQGVTDETAKSLVWRYVFLVQIARHLVAHTKSVHKRRLLPPSVRSLRKFLIANGEADDVSLYDRLLRGVSGLRGSISLEAFGIKISADAKEPASAASEGARAHRQLDVIEHAVAAAADELGCKSHSTFLLLVDQLEQIWSNDKESDAMVIGLLLASKRVHSALAGVARCVLFLRADIYDVLHFGDGDKFHGDEVRIDWSESRLCELAAMRARVSLGLDEDAFWTRVMPPSVHGQPPKEYILWRVLPRPRDIIQFLNAARDEAFERGEKRISETSLLHAELRFSQWKLQDLAKEYLTVYPYLDRLFVIFQSGGYLVTRGSIAKRFEPVRGALLQQFGGYANVLNPDSVVEALYSVGFLGVRRNSTVHYAGIDHVGLQPHENVFEIHPCFRVALNTVHEAELTKYTPSIAVVQGIQIGTSNLQTSVFGADFVAASRPSRDRRLLESVVRACDRILARLGRTSLPSGMRDQIVHQITALGTTTRAIITGVEDGTASEEAVSAQPYRAADYLDVMAGELASSGLSEAGNIGVVVDALREETRRLRAELRGSELS